MTGNGGETDRSFESGALAGEWTAELRAEGVFFLPDDPHEAQQVLSDADPDEALRLADLDAAHRLLVITLAKERLHPMPVDVEVDDVESELKKIAQVGALVVTQGDRRWFEFIGEKFPGKGMEPSDGWLIGEALAHDGESGQLGHYLVQVEMSQFLLDAQIDQAAAEAIDEEALERISYWALLRRHYGQHDFGGLELDHGYEALRIMAEAGMTSGLWAAFVERFFPTLPETPTDDPPS